LLQRYQLREDHHSWIADAILAGALFLLLAMPTNGAPLDADVRTRVLQEIEAGGIHVALELLTVDVDNPDLRTLSAQRAVYRAGKAGSDGKGLHLGWAAWYLGDLSLAEHWWNTAFSENTSHRRIPPDGSANWYTSWMLAQKTVIFLIREDLEAAARTAQEIRCEDLPDLPEFKALVEIVPKLKQAPTDAELWLDLAEQVLSKARFSDGWGLSSIIAITDRALALPSGNSSSQALRALLIKLATYRGVNDAVADSLVDQIATHSPSADIDRILLDNWRLRHRERPEWASSLLTKVRPRDRSRVREYSTCHACHQPLDGARVRQMSGCRSARNSRNGSATRRGAPLDNRVDASAGPDIVVGLRGCHELVSGHPLSGMQGVPIGRSHTQVVVQATPSICPRHNGGGANLQVDYAVF
jgi:hypothetical protein